MEHTVEDVSTRLSSLSIVVDDVDERIKGSFSQTQKEEPIPEMQENVETPESSTQTGNNPYPKHVLEDAIRDIMEEAELRRVEFRKLLDEHDALVENLKKMEKENSPAPTFMCNVAHSPIMT
uniref:Uncharacterized protein LOC114329872 n=1 Tax=Diabrotica virgifera virgifera TaxID=50390 RepID=A0A6P7FGC5_DIAVI